MSADKISTKICEILTPFKKIRSEKKTASLFPPTSFKFFKVLI